MRIYELITDSGKLFKNGDIQGAILKLNHALIVEPNNKEAKELLLDLYIEIDDITNSLSVSNELLKIEPENTKYLFVKAHCLCELNELDISV